MTGGDRTAGGPGEPRSAKRAGFRLVQVALLFLTALLVASLVTTAVTDASGLPTDATAYTLLRTVTQFLCFGAVAVGYLALSEDLALLRVSVPTRRQAATVVVGTVVLYGAQLLLLFAFDAVGVQPVENRAVSASRGPLYFLAMVPLSVLLVGPAEELLFRGALQGLLERPLGSWPAIVVATALFGIVHGGVGPGTPIQKLAYVGIAAILGVGLGYLYVRTRNLVVPALVHGCYNAIIFAQSYLEAVGAF